MNSTKKKMRNTITFVIMFAMLFSLLSDVTFTPTKVYAEDEETISADAAEVSDNEIEEQNVEEVIYDDEEYEEDDWYDYSDFAFEEEEEVTFSDDNAEDMQINYEVVDDYTQPNGTIYVSNAIALDDSSTFFLKANLVENTKKQTAYVTLTWQKVKGAEYYEVYRMTSKGGKYLYKVITFNEKKNTYKVKDLEWGMGYGYAIKAVRGNGRFKKSRTSNIVRFAVGSEKYTNVKKIKAKNKKIMLGETCNVEPVLTFQYKNKKLLDKLTYYSADKNIVTVSEDGTITAKAKGKTKIYILAINGIRKTINVTVM